MEQAIFNTPFNTPGIGNVRPAGINDLGSGDLLYPSQKPAKKKAAPQIFQNEYCKQQPLVVYKK